MVNVIWSPDNLPGERHVVVQPHGQPSGKVKAYFYDSDEGDDGGSGPFDFLLDEALRRAERFAYHKGIRTIIVLKAELDKA
ncbi:hypothetical protein [uncultured Cohaesibacter sp.]|uniref:hypothetical protein n=1 Tax=uncultured Cohaesibacter sp. TaxID=1002546 RepID=UPI0029C64221|nr:hypothetical protein [uncultured Cohaesibacter sp.]